MILEIPRHLLYNKNGFFGDSFQGILGKEPNISVSPFFPLPKNNDQKLLEFLTFWDVEVEPLNPSRLSLGKRNGSTLGHWTKKPPGDFLPISPFK